MTNKDRVTGRDWLIVIIAFVAAIFLSCGFLGIVYPLFRWVCYGSGAVVALLTWWVTREPKPKAGKQEE